MKRVLMLTALALSASGALACPMCNIFNYLYPNLRAAPNIVVATVQGEADERNALVKIDRVLRGSHKRGDVVRWEMWDAKKQKGKQFIYDDTQAFGASFKVLPMELEWEVTFLIRGAPYDKEEGDAMDMFGEMDVEGNLEQTAEKRRPAIRNAEEAVLAVQGVSKVSRHLGLGYVKGHAQDCYPLLIKALNVRRKDFAAKPDSAFAAHATDGLVEGIWASNDNRGAQLLSGVVSSFLAGTDAGLNLAKVAWEPDLETQYLTSILEWSKQRPTAQASLRETLVKSLPNCRGRVLASMVYAAHKSALLTPEQVEQAASLAIGAAPTEADAVALAFYHIGWHHGRWWATDKAIRAFQFAQKYCRNDKLKNLIDEGIKPVKAK